MLSTGFINPANLAIGEPPISQTELSFQPLYLQVRKELLSRLIDGRWPQGMMLPSEHQLANELGVSQGTVRKALDALTADGLVLRQQGRGTFVAEPEEGHFLFKFFRIYADDGGRPLPTSRVYRCKRSAADKAARQHLDLPANSVIWQIERIRSLDSRPIVFERSIVAVDRFPDLDRIDPVVNNLYALLSSRYGVTIRRASERLKAVAANRTDGKHLGCPVGTPLLFIDRMAFALDGAPVEWRLARCLTDKFHYQSLIT
jgi:GntR family transcriptional regulator